MTPYIDVTAADAYAADLLLSDGWTGSDVTLKQKSLNWATEIINQLPFIGYKDPAQENAFPRYEIPTIPDAIKKACFYLAYHLISGAEPEKEFELLRIKSHTMEFTKTEYDVTASATHILAGVPSLTAWRYLAPYLRDGRTIEVRRRS